MRLADALELRRRLEARSGTPYTVRRSGKRSPDVSPFYVERRPFNPKGKRSA